MSTPKTYTTQKGKRAAIARAREAVIDCASSLDEHDLAYGTDDLELAIVRLDRAIRHLRSAVYAKVVPHV